MGEKPKNKDADKVGDGDRRVDEGLKETFPASDPPSASQPGGGGPEPDKPAPP